MKELTIISVTYNSKEVIDKSLSEISSGDFDIIIVDNASRDDTAEYISQKYPSIKLIKSAKNIGFGRGCNLGLREVKTRYSLLLNPDVITTSGAINELLTKLKQHPKPAIFAPRTRKDKKYDDSQPNEKQAWVSGAVMLFETDMLNKIGYFDENIFLFSEEIDLCTRAAKAGYDIILCNEIYMDHLVGKSSSPDPGITHMKYWHMGWSRLYYNQKHETRLKFIKNSFLSILKYMMKLLINIISGNKTKAAKYKGLLIGSISYLIGLGAFDKNDKPGGMS